MPDRSEQDILAAIDELSADAATWTATGTHERPEWNTPAPGAMKAILLGATNFGTVDISRADPLRTWPDRSVTRCSAASATSSP